MTPPAEAAVAHGTEPAGMSEWDLRVQLAACYRVFDMMGWTELIYNHITVKVPGPEMHFLINPFGLHYSEVTASNLVKVDLDGTIVGDSDWPINPAGYVIHSAIHEARLDVKCVMHTHTTTGMAVACPEEGLIQCNFYSAMLQDEVAYHDFEGLTTRDDEGPRMVRAIGDKDYVILRNHGLLTCGRSIPEAFNRLFRLQRACDVQVMAYGMGRPVRPVTEEAATNSTRDNKTFDPEGRGAERDFEALVRLVERRDASFRS